MPAAGRLAWVLVLCGLTAGLAVLRMLETPTLVEQSLAAALAVTLALGLAVRSGAHVPLALVLAVLIAVSAVAIEWPPLLAGAAVATGVLAACLAVLGTRPAPTLPAVVLEVLLALLVATAGALGVAGFAAEIDAERYDYTVLGLSLVATLALVHRLGGGLHALGRGGLALAVAAVLLLLVVLVYTAALTRYGTPELVGQARTALGWTREHLGGVPHPAEVLVGIPALAWGVALRSRRRQGWWACAFGTAATAHVAGDLAGGGGTLQGTVLGVLYATVLGLLLGFALIGLERLRTAKDRRHGRTLPVAPRAEPPRLHPLH